MGKGMSVGVSFTAYPNIMPWSPAPTASNASEPASPCCASKDWSTPWAMSGDCPWMEFITPQVLASKPNLARL